MTIPEVSVIIPTYNRAGVLGRALRSVAAQTYKDYEVLVVDDGSTDDTKSVVQVWRDEFNSALKYIKYAENRGGAAARNAGLQASRGEYIAFLDADDEWLPPKLEKQIAAFSECPREVGFVSTSYRLVDEGGTVLTHLPQKPMEGDLSAEMIEAVEGSYEIVGVFSTLMFRKEVIREVGLLDETLPCWHDCDFYLRAARHFQFKFLAELLTVKHELPDSISSNLDLQARGVRSFWEKHRGLLGSRSTFRRYMAMRHHSLGVEICLHGGLAEGRRMLFEALRICPRQWRSMMHFCLSLAGAGTYRKMGSKMLSMRERLRPVG